MSGSPHNTDDRAARFSWSEQELSQVEIWAPGGDGLESWPDASRPTRRTTPARTRGAANGRQRGR